MPNIFYRGSGRTDEHGNEIEYATWPGTSVRKDGKVGKKDPLYLGRVIDKEANIFFNKEHGYFRFDPSDQSFHDIGKDTSVQACASSLGIEEDISSLRFGGSYFLGRLISGINYNTVLDAIPTERSDRLYALILFYLLSDLTDKHSAIWFEKSYAKYLYPEANIYSQRISEFYQKIGKDDSNITKFLGKHIEYVLKSTDDECCIIIDSTGCQNACDVDITRISRHENEVNVEYRVAVVVQRSTGLPLYFKVIPGNVVDIATTENIRISLECLGLKVTEILADAGYCCPKNMERLILEGSDFMMRLNPAYNLYKNAMAENLSRLFSRNDEAVKHIVYRNRHLNILKLPTVIGTNKETGEEKQGFIFLCMDEEAYHEKVSRLLKGNKDRKHPLTEQELQEAKDKLGVFAIVVTRDMDEADILPAYYMRQAIEQFFDYAKNDVRMLPVRNHNEMTINGHMMISFIATFLCVLIKNRMNLMDFPYCVIPEYLRSKITDDEETITVTTKNGEENLVLVQDPLQTIFEASPGALLKELELVGAIYYPEKKEIGRKRTIVPDSPHRNAKDFLEAFGLAFPLKIELLENGSLLYFYDKNVKESCSQALAFTRPITEEDKIKAVEEKARIEQEKKEQEEKKRAEKLAKELVKEQEKIKQEPPQPRKIGRPKGALNKKTIVKMEEQKRLEELGLAKPKEKRGRGRPKGSRNRKTMDKNQKENA